MSSFSQPSLALLSINVNGLKQKAKRLTLFSSLIDGPWDIIVLQETHHTDEEQGQVDQGGRWKWQTVAWLLLLGSRHFGFQGSCYSVQR